MIIALYKKGDNSQCSSFNICLVSVASTLPSMMIIFRLIDTVNKVLRKGNMVLRIEEDTSTKFFTLRITIENFLSYSDPFSPQFYRL